MPEPEQIGALKTDRPLVRADLDKMLADCGADATGVIALGCTQCQSKLLQFTYTRGLVVIVCEPCEKPVAAVVVAGSEFNALAEIKTHLLELRDLLHDDDAPE